MKLDKLTRTKLVDQVVEAIYQKISDNQIQPGEKLPGEIELSQQLGVARTTLREALSQLMGLGLLERREYGIYVAPEISSVIQSRLVPLVLIGKETKKLFEARRILEGEIAALAVKRATATDIAELENLNERLEKGFANDQAYWELDMSFHQELARIADNNILNAMYNLIRELLNKYEAQIVRLADIKSLTSGWHAEIIDAIKKKDPGQARRRVHAALRRSEAAIIKAHIAATLGKEEAAQAGRPELPDAAELAK